MHDPCQSCQFQKPLDHAVSIFHLQANELATFECIARTLNRGSCMRAYVLLNLLNGWGKEIKCEACRAFYLFFATSLINSIKHEHEY